MQGEVHLEGYCLKCLPLSLSLQPAQVLYPSFPDRWLFLSGGGEADYIFSPLVLRQMLGLASLPLCSAL